MFEFFINRPINLIPYFIGLISLFFAGFMTREFPIGFILNSISFSLWYMVFLICDSKELKLDDLYKELRELLVRRIIGSSGK
jgi:hypothetical protein